MIRLLAVAAVLLALAGCDCVLSPEEVDAATRACVARGGSPDFVHTQRGRGPVLRVDCWGAH